MQKIKQISEEILTLCENANTALKAIHLIVQHGSASELAWQTVYNRVMADNDVDGAYYLANFTQKIDDLPFDGLPLIEMVMNGDDKNMKLSLIDKMPKQIQQEYLSRV
ncbi:hypothetical protein LU276_03755 [Moraxella haemolytica]|uniref:hypothetical protein n=1 Tax=Moraxella TaxID=475 RepID=UPI0025438D79|nr:hypothetical protein [Moraxella sp. ZY171148]WII95938.1 hypothetical protein LU276_03755 [Moraxella sp. ZY171148]